VKLRVLLVDDHEPLLRQIKSLLSPEFEIVGAVTNGSDMVTAAAQLRPDVIVADVAMPGLSGIDASRLVRERHPDLPIVMLSMHKDSELVQQALGAGALGYVHKLSAGEELIPAIYSAARGQVFISPSCLPRSGT
jgi:DNA-binding NarL/FixJ family response regulator